MLAMLKKDFFVLKSQLKSFLLVTAVFFAVSIGSGAEGLSLFYSAMTALFIVMLAVSTFTYDTTSHWDGFALTLPVSRNSLVTGKYVLGLLMVVVGSIVGMLFYFAASAICKLEISYQTQMVVTCLTLTGAFVMLAVSYPAMYKWGSEKGRIVMMACFFLPALVVMLVGKTGALAAIDVDLILQWMQGHYWLFPIGGVVLFALSYLLSLRICRKKEY